MKIRQTLNTTLLKLHLLPFVTAFRSLKVLEVDYGHFKSVNGWRAVDRYGSPIPWFTYPAIDYLKSLDFSKKKVFEYGSGSSTLFWAKKALKVISVENNKEWFFEILNKVKGNKNVRLLLLENKESYITALQKYKLKFDLIIIDGLYRKNCAELALKSISTKGVIILDNAERYPKICSNLRRRGLIQVDFTGFSPINPYISCTSLFISKQFTPTFNKP